MDFTEKRLRYLNPENQMVQKRQYLIDIEERLFRNMKNELQKKKQMMSLLAARLDAKSPLKRLAGGYAYVTDEAGRDGGFREITSSKRCFDDDIFRWRCEK